MERIQSSDRKSTRLNSSHLGISYAVFCLKKIVLCRLSACACKATEGDGLSPLARERDPQQELPLVHVAMQQSVDVEKMLRALFFNDAATTEIYALSLHDALPI